ncbi:MAG: di-trans,poly-cis-decaprenylcistransferase [Clostridia bacterium]|nr:di-trans,poly-cis-decaprenylcistransferase [Clostridia bacterium]
MTKILKVPQHIAFIMDGNGRWATRRGLPRNAGHKAGVKAIEKTIDACIKYGVKYATFFAFSTENWKRSKEEIDGIFKLLREYIAKEDNLFVKKHVRLNSIGVLDPFPEDLKQSLEKTKKDTQNYDKLTVTFALNYGGRDDIIRAVNTLIKEGKKEITDKELLATLDTKSIPEPDFVLRTSGENRISNFMLFQMAYSELYFPKVLWPDFDEKHLVKALKVYAKRDRRYGGIK